MPKSLRRVLAFLLVPCLLSESVATTTVAHVWRTVLVSQWPNTKIPASFNSQTLATWLEFSRLPFGKKRSSSLQNELQGVITKEESETQNEVPISTPKDENLLLATAFRDLLENDMASLLSMPLSVLDHWIIFGPILRNPDGNYIEAILHLFQKAAEIFSAQWRARGHDETFGHWNGILFWTMLAHFYDNAEDERNAYDRAVLFNRGSLEDQLIGYWTATTLLAHHIQGIGPHSEGESVKVDIDLELLIRSLRALISLSVAWKQLHPAPRNLRDERFLNYIEHTLARALDPAIYDKHLDNLTSDSLWIYIYHRLPGDESLAFAEDFYPEETIDQISKFLRNIPRTQTTPTGIHYDELSRGPFIPEQDVNELLAPAIARTPQDWRDENFNPPLIDWERLTSPTIRPITRTISVGIFWIIDQLKRLSPWVEDVYVKKLHALQISVLTKASPRLRFLLQNNTAVAASAEKSADVRQFPLRSPKEAIELLISHRAMISNYREKDELLKALTAISAGKPRKVLVVGAGISYLTEALAVMGIQVVFADMERRFTWPVENGVSELVRDGLIAMKPLVVLSNADELRQKLSEKSSEITSDYFDMTLLLSLAGGGFEGDAEEAVRNAYRLTRSGGMVYFPNGLVEKKNGERRMMGEILMDQCPECQRNIGMTPIQTFYDQMDQVFGSNEKAENWAYNIIKDPLEHTRVETFRRAA